VEQICRPWSGRQMMAAYMVYDLRELRRDEEPLNKSPGLEEPLLPFRLAHPEHEAQGFHSFLLDTKANKW
jgi:hypothetical protein